MARNSIIGWIVKKLKGNMALVEDTETASQNISANKYVVFQGVLCTADAAISQGDTLATSGAGKNLTEVTGGGFNELNDHISKIIQKGSLGHIDTNETKTFSFPTGTSKSNFVPVASALELSGDYYTGVIEVQLLSNSGILVHNSGGSGGNCVVWYAVVS